MVYLERLYSVIYELATQGDAVFLGRGSHLLLRDFPCALHVRVTASPETCLRTLLDQGLNRGAAARAIKLRSVKGVESVENVIQVIAVQAGV
jgi:hypothetical protein